MKDTSNTEVRRRAQSKPKPAPELCERRIKIFWSKVDKSGDCWMWKGLKSRSGYGLYVMYGTHRTVQHRAHRVSYFLHHGSIDDDLLVCHRCDVPACVNPAHLFQGTTADNIHDAISKGRSNPIAIRMTSFIHIQGERHPFVKLNNEIVLDIFRSKLANRKLARIYGITHRHVADIKKGYMWNCVTGLPKKFRPHHLKKHPRKEQLCAGTSG